MDIVCVQAVTKDYDLGQTKVHALRGIDLSIQEGEFISIAGASGSGKSTLLNLIGGSIIPPVGRLESMGSVLITCMNGN